MKIHILQHEPLVGPGFIQEWAEEKGHELLITRVDLYETFPPIEELSFLIILGGQPGVYEEDQHSWLVEEKAWVQSAVKEGKHILGICMGAQLLADIHGATVEEASYKEIGWWPVNLVFGDERHPLLTSLPDRMKFFQFHKDTFTIPRGAVLQAGNAAFCNQAFSIGDRILAVQFHPEMNKEIINGAMKELGHTIEEGAFSQSANEIIRNSSFNESRQHIFTILDNFEKQIVAQCNQRQLQ